MEKFRRQMQKCIENVYFLPEYLNILLIEISLKGQGVPINIFLKEELPPSPHVPPQFKHCVNNNKCQTN